MHGRRCYWSCERKDQVVPASSGWRGTFYYPGGGSYKGCWLNGQHHRYGVKTSKGQLIYDGQWLNGQRHGHGTLRRQQADGTFERIYVGEWKNDLKHGEGKQFYADGVYYGLWLNNRRHGIGIMWFNDGSIYMGEWQANVSHGVGVHFYVNGNRYEGHFVRGFKNGEGTFYHMHTGQIQKGMWENGVCKASLMLDDFRNQVERPSEYPIPKLLIANADRFVSNLFHQYMPNADKPSKSFVELTCLNFVRKMKRYAKFEPDSKIPSMFVDA